MTVFALSLGSNVGESVALMRQALALVAADEETRIDAVSSFYRTPPWGRLDQPPFVNACAIGRTALSPSALLRLCKSIEARLGRRARGRWGPREIDLDILFMDGVDITTSELAIPHRALHERLFVLVPLAELAPDRVVRGRSIRDWLARLSASDPDERARILPVESPVAPRLGAETAAAHASL